MFWPASPLSRRACRARRRSRRLALYGPNVLRARGVSALSVLVRQVRSYLLGLLLFAAVVSAVVGDRHGGADHRRHHGDERRPELLQRVPVGEGGRGSALPDPAPRIRRARRTAGRGERHRDRSGRRRAPACRRRGARRPAPAGGARARVRRVGADGRVAALRQDGRRAAARATRRSICRRARSWARSCAAATGAGSSSARARTPRSARSRCGWASGRGRPPSSRGCRRSRGCSRSSPRCWRARSS